MFAYVTGKKLNFFMVMCNGTLSCAFTFQVTFPSDLSYVYQSVLYWIS
jgi:hypothetical protein